MAKPNSRRTTWIWLSVLILFVCVAATTIAFMSRLDSFLLDDEGAISLITEDTSETDDSSDETDDTQSQDSTATQDSETEQDSTSSTDTPGTDETDPSTSTTPEVTQPPKNPGFEAGDDKTVWGTNTQVEIFSVSYVNGEQIITVKSDNGDKVIAPGTENSYTFKLKNTGNVALDYTVEIDAYFTPADITIPITGRLNRYDGKWVVAARTSMQMFRCWIQQPTARRSVPESTPTIPLIGFGLLKAEMMNLTPCSAILPQSKS